MPARRAIGALLFVVSLGAATAASGQGQPRGDGAGPRQAPPPATAAAPRSGMPVLPPVAIVPRDRGVIQNYYRSQAQAGHCPPGQAKKNGGGCLPPIEARSAAPMAQKPTSMSIQPLPRPLLERLTAPPNGYAYGYSNGSVVLYSTGSRTIADSTPAY